MSNWYDCRVKKAGANSSGNALYVWLVDDSGIIDNYYELDAGQGDQLLATALTALSLDLPVDAYIGDDPVNDQKNPEYYYCNAMYVRRG